MKNDYALMIGNGVNLLTKGHVSWDSLLQKLIDLTKGEVELTDIKKSRFPLLYEEVLLNLLEQGWSEKKVLEEFTYIIENLRYNEMHRQIVSIGAKNIITTNYDFCLEKALGKTIPKSKGKAQKPLKVNYDINGIRFWHIHGDVNRKERIVLGYHEYGNSIQQMDEYFYDEFKRIKMDKRASGTKERDELVIKSLIKRHPEEVVKNIVEVMFTKDVYILGLGMEVQEMDLWWLINKRARYSKLVTNKIVYYTEKKDTEDYLDKINLLKTMNVDVVEFELDNNDYMTIYKKSIEDIKFKIGTNTIKHKEIHEYIVSKNIL